MQGIKLNDGDEVVDAHILSTNTKEILSIHSKVCVRELTMKNFQYVIEQLKVQLCKKLREEVIP